MPERKHSVEIKAKVIPHKHGSGSFTTLTIEMGTEIHWTLDNSHAYEEGRSAKLTLFLDNILVVKEIMGVANAIIQDQPNA